MSDEREEVTGPFEEPANTLPADGPDTPEDAAAKKANGHEKPEVEYEIEDVDTLRSGRDSFASSGHAMIKTVRGGKPIFRRFRIKSLPPNYEEDLLDEPEPVAPRVKKWAKPGSEWAIAHGKGDTGCPVIAFDYTDKKYREAAKVYTMRKGWAMIEKGLDHKLEYSDGRPAKSQADRIQVLQEMGFNDTQFAELVTAIVELTKLTEEERYALLGEGSGSGRMPEVTG